MTSERIWQNSTRSRGTHFFFSSRRRHTRCLSDWSSDVCSSDLRPERPHPRLLFSPIRLVSSTSRLSDTLKTASASGLASSARRSLSNREWVARFQASRNYRANIRQKVVHLPHTRLLDQEAAGGGRKKESNSLPLQPLHSVRSEQALNFALMITDCAREKQTAEW